MKNFGLIGDCPRPLNIISELLKFHDCVPPPGWYMWVGRYKGSNWNTRFRHIGAKSIPRSTPTVEPPKVNNVHSTMFVVGEFALYVMGSTDLGFINRPNEFVQVFAQSFGFRSIWPYFQGTIAWNVVPISGDTDISEMADWLQGIPKAISD